MELCEPLCDVVGDVLRLVFFEMWCYSAFMVRKLFILFIPFLFLSCASSKVAPVYGRALSDLKTFDFMELNYEK